MHHRPTATITALALACVVCQLGCAPDDAADSGSPPDAAPVQDAQMPSADGGTDGGSMDSGSIADAGQDAAVGIDARTDDATIADASPLTDATPIDLDSASADGGLSTGDAAVDSGVAWVDCGGGTACPMLPTTQACADVFQMSFMSQYQCDGFVERTTYTSRSLAGAVDSFASSSSIPGEPELWYAFDLPACPAAGAGFCSESYLVVVGSSYGGPGVPPPPHVTIFDRCTGLEVYDGRWAMTHVTLPTGSYVAMVEVSSTSGSVIFDLIANRREYEPLPGC